MLCGGSMRVPCDSTINFYMTGTRGAVFLTVPDDLLDAYDQTVATDSSQQPKALDVLAAHLHTLSRKFLVAARDPHADDDSIARLRARFERTFRCCITTNLYLSGECASTGRHRLEGSWWLSLYVL
eukprot:m.137250 g.137250  ORF g.137250 m.137250 type:complete len:126 (+) comp17583_c0_seq3:2000-2377(+)